jgi:hypothetical protein
LGTVELARQQFTSSYHIDSNLNNLSFFTKYPFVIGFTHLHHNAFFTTIKIIKTDQAIINEFVDTFDNSNELYLMDCFEEILTLFIFLASL